MLTSTVAEKARGLKEQVAATASDTVDTVREKVAVAADVVAEKER